MNLTEMDEADARRLVDFAAGLAFGLRGTHRARDQPGVPALAGQHPGHRRGQGQDRRGWVLQPELTLTEGRRLPCCRSCSRSLYLLLYVFFLMLLARFVLGTVLQYGRRWQPGRGAAAALESVWSVTDPPLKALRRVIPPLRIGTVSFDLASLVLLVILFVLMKFVLAPSDQLASAC